MEIFNAPNRELCAVRRAKDQHAPQALVTLGNDPQFVEVHDLAEQAIKEATSDDERLDFITRRLIARTLRPRNVR
jgi:hypothetical protein